MRRVASAAAPWRRRLRCPCGPGGSCAAFPASIASWPTRPAVVAGSRSAPRGSARPSWPSAGPSAIPCSPGRCLAPQRAGTRRSAAGALPARCRPRPRSTRSARAATARRTRNSIASATRTLWPPGGRRRGSGGPAGRLVSGPGGGAAGPAGPAGGPGAEAAAAVLRGDRLDEAAVRATPTVPRRAPARCPGLNHLPTWRQCFPAACLPLP